MANTASDGNSYRSYVRAFCDTPKMKEVTWMQNTLETVVVKAHVEEVMIQSRIVVQ